MPRFLAEDYLQKAVLSKTNMLNKMLTVYPKYFPSISLMELEKQTGFLPWRKASHFSIHKTTSTEENPELTTLIHELSASKSFDLQRSTLEHYFYNDGGSDEFFDSSSELFSNELSNALSETNEYTFSLEIFSEKLSCFSSKEKIKFDKDNDMVIDDVLEVSFNTIKPQAFSPQVILEKLPPAYLSDPLKQLGKYQAMFDIESFNFNEFENHWSNSSLFLDCHPSSVKIQEISDDIVYMYVEESELSKVTKNLELFMKEGLNDSCIPTKASEKVQSLFVQPQLRRFDCGLERLPAFDYFHDKPGPAQLRINGDLEVFLSLTPETNYVKESFSNLKLFDVKSGTCSRLKGFCSFAKKHQQILEYHLSPFSKRLKRQLYLSDSMENPVFEMKSAQSVAKETATLLHVKKETVDRLAYLVWEVADYFPKCLSRLRRYAKFERLAQDLANYLDQDDSLLWKSYGIDFLNIPDTVLRSHLEISVSEQVFNSSLNNCVMNQQTLLQKKVEVAPNNVDKNYVCDDPQSYQQSNMRIDKKESLQNESTCDVRLDRFIKMRGAKQCNNNMASVDEALSKEKRDFLKGLKPMSNQSKGMQNKIKSGKCDKESLQSIPNEKASTILANNSDEGKFSKTIKVYLTGKVLDFILMLEETVQPFIDNLKSRKTLPNDKDLPEYTTDLAQFLCWQQRKKIESSENDEDVQNYYLLEMFKQVVMTHSLILHVSCQSALAYLKHFVKKVLKPSALQKYRLICSFVTLLQKVVGLMEFNLNSTKVSTSSIVHPKVEKLRSIVYSEAVKWKERGEFSKFKALVVCETKCSYLLSTISSTLKSCASKHAKLKIHMVECNALSISKTEVEDISKRCHVLVIATKMMNEELTWSNYSHIFEFEHHDLSSYRDAATINKLKHFSFKSVIPTSDGMSLLDSSDKCKAQRTVIGSNMNLSLMRAVLHVLEVRHNLVVMERTNASLSGDGKASILVNHNTCILLENFEDLGQTEVCTSVFLRARELQRKFIRIFFVFYLEDATAGGSGDEFSLASVSFGKLISWNQHAELKQIKVDFRCCFGSESLGSAINEIVHRHPVITDSNTNKSLSILPVISKSESFLLEFPCINDYSANYILSVLSPERLLTMTKEEIENNLNEIDSRILQDFCTCLNDVKECIRRVETNKYQKSFLISHEKNSNESLVCQLAKKDSMIQGRDVRCHGDGPDQFVSGRMIGDDSVANLKKEYKYFDHSLAHQQFQMSVEQPDNLKADVSCDENHLENDRGDMFSICAEADTNIGKDYEKLFNLDQKTLKKIHQANRIQQEFPKISSSAHQGHGVVKLRSCEKKVDCSDVGNRITNYDFAEASIPSDLDESFRQGSSGQVFDHSLMAANDSSVKSDGSNLAKDSYAELLNQGFVDSTSCERLYRNLSRDKVQNVDQNVKEGIMFGTFDQSFAEVQNNGIYEQKFMDRSTDVKIDQSVTDRTSFEKSDCSFSKNFRFRSTPQGRFKTEKSVPSINQLPTYEDYEESFRESLNCSYSSGQISDGHNKTLEASVPCQNFINTESCRSSDPLSITKLSNKRRFNPFDHSFREVELSTPDRFSMAFETQRIANASSTSQNQQEESTFRRLTAKSTDGLTGRAGTDLYGVHDPHKPGKFIFPKSSSNSSFKMERSNSEVFERSMTTPERFGLLFKMPQLPGKNRLHKPSLMKNRSRNAGDDSSLFGCPNVCDQSEMKDSFSTGNQSSNEWKDRRPQDCNIRDESNQLNSSRNSITMTSSGKRQKMLTFEKVKGAKGGQTKLVFY